MGFFFICLVLAHLVHEGGHLIAAWLMGARPLVVQLGLGKSHTRSSGRLQVGVASVPLGLFCGFEPLAALARWKRTLVVLAGPATSWTLSFLVLYTAFSGTREARLPVVETVFPGSAAQRAGIQPDDHIRRVGDRPVETFDELKKRVQSHPGGAVPVTIERRGAPMVLTVEMPAGGPIGIRPQTSELVGLDAAAAAAIGTLTMPLETLADTTKGLALLVRSRGSMQTVGGPVLIYRASEGTQGSAFWRLFAEMFATVSLLFLLLPLLPIPGFDGARLLRR